MPKLHISLNSWMDFFSEYPCTGESSNWMNFRPIQANTTIDSPSCSCDTGFQKCPEGKDTSYLILSPLPSSPKLYPYHCCSSDVALLYMFIPIWPWNTLPSIFKESMFVSLIGTFSYLHIYVCSVYMYPRTVHEIYRVCNICDVSIILCMTGAGGPEPPKKLLPSSDYLYNMTARNVSDWLVKTMERYQKRRLVTKTTPRSVLHVYTVKFYR